MIEYDIYIYPKDGSPRDWFIVEAESIWDALRRAMWEEEEQQKGDRK